MVKKRPQLSLDELYQLRWFLGGALTLLSVWTVFYLEIDAWILMGIATLAVGTCLLRPALPAGFPPALHVLAFPVVVAFFVGDIWWKGELLPAIVRLDILLLLYRGIGYRRRREDLQIIVLGLFLVVVAGVLTVSLLFAVQILAFTACALGLLLVITLIDAVEEGTAPAPVLAAGEAPAWTAVRWGRLAAHVRQVTDWRVVALGGVLFAGVVAVTALLFVALPRFQLENSLFLERFIARKARTGFSDSIKFGEITEIQQDHSVALSVDVSDPAQVPASPYWRMLVLDRYENGAFKVALPPGRISTEFVVSGTHQVWNANPVIWTFYFEPGVSRYLPLVGAFSELEFTQRQNFRHHPRLGLIALRDDPASMVAYRVKDFDVSGRLRDPVFAALPGPRATQSGGGPAIRPGLELPEAARLTLTRIVDEILTGDQTKPDPLAFGKPPTVRAEVTTDEFIRRASGWLRQRHGYTLSPRVPAGPVPDALVRWLVSTEPGHCEFFAGSLVFLARAAGYPARVVVGFRGGTWNSYSQNLTLRNSDAHAWAEIFDVVSESWLRADALGEPIAAVDAPAQGEQARTARFERGWAARMESLRVFWYRRIVSFDQRTQLDTLKAVKDATETSGRFFKRWTVAAAERWKIWTARPWDTRRIAGACALVLALAAAAWAWREWGRGAWQRATRSTRRRDDDPVRMDASRWLEKLNACEPRAPESAAVIGELQRLRFAARPTWPEPSRVFGRARHALRSARRRKRDSQG